MKHHFGARDRLGQLGREDEPAFGLVALDQLLEAGLVNRDLAAPQHRDLALRPCRRR